MTLSKKLRKEFYTEPSGTFCREYYRYLGYKDNLSSPISILRAKGVESLFTNTEPYIFKNDLTVGNIRGLYCNENEVLLNHAKSFISSIGERNFITNNDHFSPDYQHIINVGISGLLNEIEESQKIHCEDKSKCETLEAMKITLFAFAKMIKNYIAKADDLKNNSEYDNKRLEFIMHNCESLLEGAPKSFAEGLQLIWFCHIAFLLEGRNSMALGRLDQYLYPLYKKDIESGAITREDAIELLENTFTKINDACVINICIGGKDLNENCVVNDLSFCIIDAVKNCNAPGPNLSARICNNTPDEFLLKCLECIGTGLGYPALMNDEVNIPALLKHGYEKKDAYNYSMVGCIENFITGMQPPWSDARFDTPRFFDYVFNNGISTFNNSAGLNLGDVEDIKDMTDFMHKFEQQLKFGVAEYCKKFEAENSINQNYFPDPFISCFCYDCIGRGLDINNGGAKYPSVHGAALMGVGTVADSLSAIEKVVFVDKEATLTDIKNALNNNFDGYDELHKKLLDAPKYGNNDDFADKYAVWFLDYLSSLFGEFRTRDGGAIYVAMAANIMNVYAGKLISATPDGRKQGEALSDAASPTFGRDIKGVTSTLNSVTKPDYTKAACGTVINQKFSPSIFSEDKIHKILALIKTYFKKGGQEIQINSTSREILLDAMEHPEKYPTLVVRVSGFSDYYVRLDKEVQLDVLSRTQHV